MAPRIRRNPWSEGETESYLILLLLSSGMCLVFSSKSFISSSRAGLLFSPSIMWARLQKARPSSLVLSQQISPKWPRPVSWTPRKTQSISLPWGFPLPPNTTPKRFSHHRSSSVRLQDQKLLPVLINRSFNLTGDNVRFRGLQAGGKVMRRTVQVMAPILEEQLTLEEQASRDSESPLFTPLLLSPQIFTPLPDPSELRRQMLLLSKPLPPLPGNRKPVPIAKEWNFSRPFSR